MIIKHTYKYIKDDTVYYLCNTNLKPTEKIISDVKILHPDEGKILVNKATKEKVYSVPLIGDNIADNYYEIEEINDGE